MDPAIKRKLIQAEEEAIAREKQEEAQAQKESEEKKITKAQQKGGEEKTITEVYMPVTDQFILCRKSLSHTCTCVYYVMVLV